MDYKELKNVKVGDIVNAIVKGANKDLIETLLKAHKFKPEQLQGGGWFDRGNSKVIHWVDGEYKIFQTLKGNYILLTYGFFSPNIYELISEERVASMMQDDIKDFKTEY